ncbi:MAG TPA: hypothetical protein PKW80_00180 [Bacteroidales bacterium]|nr:hypothetical protein [Bacteroidales bacterium]
MNTIIEPTPKSFVYLILRLFVLNPNGKSQKIILFGVDSSLINETLR